MPLKGKQEREYDRKLFGSIQLLIIMKSRRDCFLAEFLGALASLFTIYIFLSDLNQYFKVRMKKYVRN